MITVQSAQAFLHARWNDPPFHHHPIRCSGVFSWPSRTDLRDVGGGRGEKPNYTSGRPCTGFYWYNGLVESGLMFEIFVDWLLPKKQLVCWNGLSHNNCFCFVSSWHFWKHGSPLCLLPYASDPINLVMGNFLVLCVHGCVCVQQTKFQFTQMERSLPVGQRTTLCNCFGAATCAKWHRSYKELRVQR